MLVLALSTALLAGAIGSDDETASPGEGWSLESLLRRAREERERVLEALTPRVHALVEGLEALDRPPAPGLLEALHADLDALGQEGAILLVPYVDPGQDGGEPEAFRAAEITRALTRIAPPSITSRLIELSTTGSRLGRLHAIEVLGFAPEPALVRPHLEALFREAPAETRRAAAQSLARLAGEHDPVWLRTALSDPDPEVVGVVLRALAESPNRSAIPALLELTARPAAAAPWVEEMLAVLRANIDTLDAPAVAGLLQLAADGRVAPEKRTRIVDAIAGVPFELTDEVRERAEALARSAEAGLREAALTLLALHGDRAARRDLLRPYDQMVSKNDRWPPAFERRGVVHARLGQHREAARDFDKAIELTQDQGRAPKEELWVALARAQVLDGKLRQAHDTLSQAQLPRRVLDELALDPDFRELREHARYGDVLERS